MGAQPLAPRAVFDTNVVVSALVFRSGRLTWLRDAWRSGLVVPVLSDKLVEELIRVLAYPKFELDESEISDLLADYLPFGEAWTDVVHSAGIEVADPTDAVFLDLARAAGAQWVVSGDKHLTELLEQAEVKVVRPEELRQLIAV